MLRNAQGQRSRAVSAVSGPLDLRLKGGATHLAGPRIASGWRAVVDRPIFEPSRLARHIKAGDFNGVQ